MPEHYNNASSQYKETTSGPFSRKGVFRNFLCKAMVGTNNWRLAKYG